jgi:acyl carrier protein
MTKEEIHSALEGVFQKNFNQSDLKVERETTAKDIAAWDSLSHLNLIVAVEKHFEIEISGFEVMGLENVGAMIDLIERKVQ